MVTTTKNSMDSLINNLDSSFKSSKTDFVSRSSSELYKADSKTADKNEKFKEILDLKTSTKEIDTEKLEENNKNPVSTDLKDNDVDNAKEVNEKLKELEEESKSESKDKVNDILAELLNLLAKFGIKEEDLKVNGNIDSELLKVMLDKINAEQGSNNNLKSVIEKLDTNSLKLMNNILSNLSNSLEGDNSEKAKELKSSIKNLMSEVSNMLDNKQNQHNKVLTLEDMLNKNYSQKNGESSTGDENKSASKDNKELSKEDKFLNSLIDDKNDDSLNKINLFASRTGTVQTQGVNTVRGLTINKATLVNDLIKDVKYMSNNGIKELTVKINPGNLGEITINLIQEDGAMKANLKANSKEATALLSQNLSEIKKQLSEQNFKITDVNIELYQEDTTFFNGQGFEGQLAGEQNKQNNNSQNKMSSIQGVTNEDLDENLAEENNNVNLFA